jgi:hypothetical protein
VRAVVSGQWPVTGIHGWGDSFGKHVMTARKKFEKPITLPKLPVRRADYVRVRLAQVGIDERDVSAAVLWARKKE